jgi:hypothetical protein
MVFDHLHVKYIYMYWLRSFAPKSAVTSQNKNKLYLFYVYMGTPVSSTNKTDRHDFNWNIVGSAFKHHQTNKQAPISDVELFMLRLDGADELHKIKVNTFCTCIYIYIK